MIRFLILASILFVTTLSYSQDTFRDEFNSRSYANNNGTVNWAGNWVELNDNNNAIDTYIEVTTGGQLAFNWIWNENISRTADLSGYASAVLSFDWETSNLEGGETIDILISSTGGAPFTSLRSFDNSVTTGTFSENITAYISATTTIRFENTTIDWDEANDAFFVDDVQIEAFSSDFPPVIVVTGDDEFCPTTTNSRPVAETISITDPDDTELDQLTIQISTGYQSGSDLLTLTGIHPNITTTWNVTEGRLTLIGPALLAEFEAAVLAVTYSVTPPGVGGLREFAIVLGSPLYLPETGHYYEFIPAANIRWDNARTAAALQEFFGYEGYLATLTSATESAFAGDQITGTGWIGASDSFGSGEGDWQWVTGPEAGTSFWVGNQTGTVVPGEFAFWNNNEPNDYPNAGTDGEENYAHITDDAIGINNSWNDLPIGGGGGAYAAVGYIVEYGGLPSDPVLQISGVTSIRVSCTIISNRRQTYRVGY